jgi:hypothetical protein
MKGCVDCYEVNPEYHELKNGMKICEECGGKVLADQEIMDYLANLKERLRAYSEITNNEFDIDEDFDSM